jgi:hypothetical protein
VEVVLIVHDFVLLTMEAFFFTCPESEARSLVNSMNESCICDSTYCVKDCAYLHTAPESPIENIGEICKLLDELIEIHNERQVKMSRMHISN